MVSNALVKCERGSRERQRVFYLRCFIPWISLACDSIPPVTFTFNLWDMFVYLFWISKHSHGLQSGQCTLNMDMIFCLVFILSQIQSIAHTRKLCLYWSVLRKSWERDILLIFNICLLTIIYMLF